MPTSLSYIDLPARDFSSWRPDAVFRYSQPGGWFGSAPAFQWQPRVLPTALRRRGSTARRTMSRREARFNGPFSCVKKKRELFRGPASTSQGLPNARCRFRSLQDWCRNVYRLPFPQRGQVDGRGCPRIRLLARSVEAFAVALGLTDPCTNAVGTETFSASAFKVLI